MAKNPMTFRIQFSTNVGLGLSSTLGNTVRVGGIMDESIHPETHMAWIVKMAARSIENWRAANANI